MCVRTNTGDKHIHLQLRTHSFVSFLQVVRGGLVPCFFSITTIRFWLKFQVQAKLIVPPPPSSTSSSSTSCILTELTLLRISRLSC